MDRLYQLLSGESFGARSAEVAAALSELARQGDVNQRGAVYTNASVVDAILQLVGYTQSADLPGMRVLEPAFGGGDFLFALVDRLLASYLARGGTPQRAAQDLGACVHAIELHLSTYGSTRKELERRLRAWGMSAPMAATLAGRWLFQDDFLLTDLKPGYDFVVGNPPYVRQERIPAALLQAYRGRYQTIYDRADLYVPFYERSLDLLAPRGVLGFVCSNRWVKNKYGAPLRAKVAAGFELQYYIDLNSIDAFQEQVFAYPSVTVIRRRQSFNAPSQTRVALSSKETPCAFPDLLRMLQRADECDNARVCQLEDVARGKDPWLLDRPKQLSLIRRLESTFPTLEASGCKVGIGVATGADSVYIGAYDRLAVEPDRKLPLVMASDLIAGEIRWGGKGVVNPFMADGSLAPLEDFPKLAGYVEANRDKIAGRHVAKKQPNRWYRTIDRIDPGLTKRPKLLIPDIKGAPTVVYDSGQYYPHHNLYVVVSETWDLLALQTLLRSSLALLFVAAYSVRMAGGCLRFQAQYLRRIRAPFWESIPDGLRKALVSVAASRDQDEIDHVVARLFGLSSQERALL